MALLRRSKTRRITRMAVPALAVAIAGIGLIATSACATTAALAHDRFEDVYQEGLQAFARGRSARAETAFKVAVKKNPRHPYPHYYLGVLFADAGRTELAIVAFERALELEPNFPEALYNLGTVHLGQRQFLTAAKLLEQTVDLDPDNVSAFNNLAKAYFLAGLPELAGAAYEEALALEPDNAVALENLEAMARAAGDEAAASGYRERLRRSP